MIKFEAKCVACGIPITLRVRDERAVIRLLHAAPRVRVLRRQVGSHRIAA